MNVAFLLLQSYVPQLVFRQFPRVCHSLVDVVVLQYCPGGVERVRIDEVPLSFAVQTFTQRKDSDDYMHLE